MQGSNKTSQKDNSHLDNKETLWERNQEHNTVEEEVS